MRKAGCYELLKLLREKIGVGIKVKERMSGFKSYHEILVDCMQLEEKIVSFLCQLALFEA